MIFEFVPDEHFDFINSFAQQFNIHAEADYLQFPAELGCGFIRQALRSEGLCMMIHHYQLKQDLILRRLAAEGLSDVLIFRFFEVSVSQNDHLSSVQVLTPNISVDDKLIAGSQVHYVIISIRKNQLFSMLEIDGNSSELDFFLQNVNRSFLYQDNMTLEIKRVLQAIFAQTGRERFESLYYKIKALELIYLYFVKLFQRSMRDFTGLNKRDAENILAIERRIISDLGTPPKLSVLAQSIGTNETKLKQLFKQVFGDSIYHYYQTARMNEAAYQLQHNQVRSVSDIGYALGFTNLSHFARLFKAHTGMNPKEYALQSQER